MRSVTFTSETNDGCGTLTYVPDKYPGYTIVCKDVNLSKPAHAYLVSEGKAVRREWRTGVVESNLTSVIKSESSEEVVFHDQSRKDILASGTKLKVVSADFLTAFETARQQWNQGSSA